MAIAEPGRTFDRIPDLDPRNRRYPIMALIEERTVRPRGWSLKTQLDQGSEGACFPAGTLIRKADGSHCPIEQLRLLDEVVTAEGSTGTVETMMVRWHADGLIAVRLHGLAAVRMTPQHPVLTQRGYIAAKDLRLNDYAAVPRHRVGQIKEIATAPYLRHRSPAQALQATAAFKDRWGGVTVRINTAVPATIVLTESAGRLFGLYLAEGMTTQNKVVWTFGKHERETLVPETISLIREVLGAEASPQVRHHAVNVVLYGAQWRELFSGLLGNGAGRKSLGTMAGGPESFLRGVMSGWMDGDGYRRRQRSQGTTVSRILAYDLHGMGQALGLRPALRHSVGVPTGNVRSRRDRYDIEIGDSDENSKAKQDDWTTWRKVSSLAAEPWLGSVYNLHVSGDNSYVANGLGVHNCVGFAWAHELAAIPRRVPATNDYARQIYLRAQQLDQWEGEAYQGTSVLAGAKAVQEQRHMAEYRWAFGLNQTLLALSYEGPVVLGLNWYYGMMAPDANGYVHPSGGIAGGHAIVAIAVHTATKRVVLQNSWGPDWGMNGRCYLTWDELDILLTQQGECCIPVQRRGTVMTAADEARREQYIVAILRQRGEIDEIALCRQLNGELDRYMALEDMTVICEKLEQDGLIVLRVEEANPDQGTSAIRYWRAL